MENIDHGHELQDSSESQPAEDGGGRRTPRRWAPIIIVALVLCFAAAVALFNGPRASGGASAVPAQPTGKSACPYVSGQSSEAGHDHSSGQKSSATDGDHSGGQTGSEDCCPGH